MPNVRCAKFTGPELNSTSLFTSLRIWKHGASPTPNRFIFGHVNVSDERSVFHIRTSDMSWQAFCWTRAVFFSLWTSKVSEKRCALHYIFELVTCRTKDVHFMSGIVTGWPRNVSVQRHHDMHLQTSTPLYYKTSIFLVCLFAIMIFTELHVWSAVI